MTRHQHSRQVPMQLIGERMDALMARRRELERTENPEALGAQLRALRYGSWDWLLLRSRIIAVVTEVSAMRQEFEPLAAVFIAELKRRAKEARSPQEPGTGYDRRH